jgi:LysM repeat protein
MTQAASALSSIPVRATRARPRHAQTDVGPGRRMTTATGATLVLAAVAVTASGGAAHADSAYTVRSGDTVSQIAARTGTTVAAIARANALADAARIRIGQRLVIPTSSSAASATAQPVTGVATTSTYTVVKGDTVSHIAAARGTTVAAIVSANGLNGSALIRIGQQLTIPGAGATTTQPAVVTTGATAAVALTSAASYTVVAGDTASRIASTHGTTVQAIVAANALDSRAFIRIGQQLTIPGQPTNAPTMQLVSNVFAGRTYADTVVAAANVNQSTLLTNPTPTTAQMQAKVVATARAMGVSTALAQAIAYQESGFHQNVVSPANAIGTMQVIPSSGVWASQLVGRTLNLLNPDDNATAGVAILRALIKTSPDLSTAIAGYYQGAASVQANGMFPDTRRYVASVRTLMTRFS